MLFLNRQVRQRDGHDTPGAGARDDGVRREISHATLLAEKVLVQDELSVHDGGGGSEDGVDGVGEDGGFPKVLELRGICADELLRGGGLYGLGIVYLMLARASIRGSKLLLP